MSGRIFGTLEYIKGSGEDGNRWRVNGHLPAIYASRLVPGSWSKQAGAVEISDNISNVENIEWLMMRFPLEVKSALWQERIDELHGVKRRRENLSVLSEAVADARFTGTLLSYQKQGLDFLIKTSGIALIADEMGLGKTIEALAYLVTEKDTFPCLIISPLVTLVNWEREIARFIMRSSGKPFTVKVIRSGKSGDLLPQHRQMTLPTNQSIKQLEATTSYLILHCKKLGQTLEDKGVYQILADMAEGWELDFEEFTNVDSVIEKFQAYQIRPSDDFNKEDVSNFVQLLTLNRDKMSCKSRLDSMRLGKPVVEGELFGAPQIYLINYELVARRRDDLEKIPFKTIICDECQHLRTPDSQKTEAIRELAHLESVKRRIGLSVSPETRIFLRGGPFQDGWTGFIKDAWKIISPVANLTDEDGYEVAHINHLGVETRGWTGDSFGWKDVKSFLRHPLGNVGFRELQFGGQVSPRSKDKRSNLLGVTDSHSIFVARNQLEMMTADQVKIGDIIPMDNGANWHEQSEIPVDVLSIASEFSKANVQVQLEPIGSPNAQRQRLQLGISSSSWRNYRRQGTFGTYLPLKLYLKKSGLLPEPKYVYLGKNSNPDCFQSKLYLSNLAYVLGFWLGDGWVNKNRVCFAVENAGVSALLEQLSKAGLSNFSVSPSKGASAEVRCCNVLLARVIENAVGHSYMSKYTKRIPSNWIISWPRSARMELLQGLIDSDGHEAKKRKRLYYTTVSENLAHSLMELLMSLGVQASCSSRKASDGGVVRGQRIKGKHTVYVVHWSWYAMNGQNKGRFGNRHTLNWSENHFLEAHIANVLVTPANQRPDLVYDIEVEGHPSFSANGLLAHNSGTPCYNHGTEIWSIVDVLYPGLLGTHGEFSKEFIDYEGSVKEEKREALFEFLKQNIMIRRRKVDVLDLPPKVRYRQAVQIDRSFYNMEMKKYLAQLHDKLVAAKAKTTFQAIAEEGAYRSFNAHERMTAGISKVSFVVEFVHQVMETGEPVVVFAHHNIVRNMLYERLRRYNPFRIEGGQSDCERQFAIDSFQKGTTKLLIVGLRAGSVGINLTVATQVIFAELDWSPAVHRQAEDRLHRIGQKKTVFACYLEGVGTYDEHISEKLVDKKLEIDEVLGDEKRSDQFSETEELPNETRLLVEMLEKRFSRINTEAEEEEESESS